MRLIRRRLKRLREEDGYTMVAVVAAIALITLLTAAAVAATNGDQRLIMRDLDQKRAYQAAQAGIADYTYHLNNDSGYWTRCTGVPTPNAVNQQGSTANRRAVPGATDGSQYAIELVPATGHSFCDSSNPTQSMLESTGPNIGTFRIRSTGFSGTEKQSIVATFKQATFLDYVYFTQLETSDPVTYGFANPSAALTGGMRADSFWTPGAATEHRAIHSAARRLRYGSIGLPPGWWISKWRWGTDSSLLPLSPR